jgi:predicted transglutaminase-like cysteine proteinase
VTASTVELKKPCVADLETATKINRWTNNNVVFKPDQEVWNTRDYWQTPRETLQTLHGDCEDYAIFKYFTMVSWGIPKEDVQLWYGYHYQVPHMVVTYCGLVLDSNTNDVLPLGSSTFIPKFRVDDPAIKHYQNLINRIKWLNT